MNKLKFLVVSFALALGLLSVPNANAINMQK